MATLRKDGQALSSQDLIDLQRDLGIKDLSDTVETQSETIITNGQKFGNVTNMVWSEDAPDNQDDRPDGTVYFHIGGGVFVKNADTYLAVTV